MKINYLALKFAIHLGDERMEGTTLQKSTIFILLLLIISILLISSTIFTSWRYNNVDGYDQNDIQTSEQISNMYLDHWTLSYDDFEWGGRESSITYEDELDITNEDSPAYKFDTGMLFIQKLVYLSIAFLGLLICAFIYGMKKGEFKISMILSVIAIVILLVITIYFYNLFPIGDVSEVPSFSFSGSDQNDTLNGYSIRTWGPGISWYFCILSVLLLIVAIMLMIKSSRSEQVGDGQRRGKRLGEDEGKKAHNLEKRESPCEE